MKSRLDKYDNKESFSRVNKNQNLYDDIYSNTNYSNMVVIDDSNEIDISKIKEIIDKQKNVNKRVDKTPNLEKEYDSIVPPKNYENKLYDINEVLKEAKSQRDIMEDANEKRKIQNYKFNENLDEELSKTRKVYESLVKEEKELLNIMNTLTNVSSVDLAKDMFNDLTEDSEKTQLIKPTDLADKVDVRKVPDENTEEYSTDTFMFSSKDFDDISDLRESVRKSSTFIKILIVLVVLIVLAGAGFIVALTGEIMTMPGLPKVPAATKIDVDESGKITGLF